MVPAWKGLRERDSVFFFKACEATFLLAMASLKKMLFRLEGFDFDERDRGRDGAIERGKIYNYKNVNKWNLY